MRRTMILGLHWIIIATLLVQFAYAGFQVFFVMVPDGHTGGPLFLSAVSMDADLMMARRLYALEAWVAFVGLAIYLGITEVRPTLRGSALQ